MTDHSPSNTASRARAPSPIDPAKIGDALGLSEEVLSGAQARFAKVNQRIADAAGRAGRDPAEITLVGVAKRQPAERILAAVAAGVRVLGQSYIQEAREIRPQIESALTAWPESESTASKATVQGPDLRWHMVGRLQRNKAGLAARLFETVESVDRPKLVESLARRASEEDKILDVLVQLSLCGEAQKGGCEVDDLPPLAELIMASPSLRLRGLMTVPAANADPEASRPAFARLRGLREELARLDPDLALGALSMGMSADLEVAVEEGATLVRVGTALFGDRIT